MYVKYILLHFQCIENLPNLLFYVEISVYTENKAAAVRMGLCQYLYLYDPCIIFLETFTELFNLILFRLYHVYRTSPMKCVHKLSFV